MPLLPTLSGMKREWYVCMYVCFCTVNVMLQKMTRSIRSLELVTAQIELDKNLPAIETM
jgi:hypothetical protein